MLAVGTDRLLLVVRTSHGSLFEDRNRVHVKLVSVDKRDGNQTKEFFVTISALLPAYHKRGSDGDADGEEGEKDDMERCVRTIALPAAKGYRMVDKLTHWMGQIEVLLQEHE